MAMNFACLMLAVAFATCIPCDAGSSGSMVRREAREARVGKSRLQETIGRLLQGEAAQRVFQVEANVRSTYEALPKNAVGRIPPAEFFPAIVRNYFAKEHGWLITGLEPPSMKPLRTEVHEALVFQEHAPDVVQALKEVRESSKGLSLSDVVGTIVALEKLILDETMPVLKGAYMLNNLNVANALDEANVSLVLHSYLLLFRHGNPHNFLDMEGHQKIVARAKEAEDWISLVNFTRDTIAESNRKGPFSFEVVSDIVRDLGRKYGRWQNSECDEMKATLMELGTNGSGSVRLKDFHSEPSHASFQFTESADYLQKTGSLEEIDGEQRVTIVNYLLGPSNCIAKSGYYSVCCLSECEGLMNALEERVEEPTSLPATLLQLVEELPSSTEVAPRELLVDVSLDLKASAEALGASIPLHSAVFKRWMHKAYPNECPLPTAADSAAEESEATAAREWLEPPRQECTRIPQWHRDAEALVNVNV